MRIWEATFDSSKSTSLKLEPHLLKAMEETSSSRSTAYDSKRLRCVIAEELTAQKRQKEESLKLPWEKGWYANFFQGKTNLPKMDLTLPTIGLEAVPAIMGTPATPSSQPSHKLQDYAKMRLQLARLLTTEDAMRHGALRKLREIVMAKPTATQLGKRLLSFSSTLCNEDKLRTTFQDTFANKATATLTKRCSALWKAHSWWRDNGGVSIFEMDETSVYTYLCHLRDSKAAPTSGQSFLEAMTFIFHLAEADSRKTSAMYSSRIRGCIGSMLEKKRPLKQALPLTVFAVLFLESLIHTLVDDHLKVILGHLLLCIFSCSRFADSIFLDEIHLTTSGRLYLVETASKRYKTGTKEKKQKFLPLVALGQGLFDQPWAEDWLKARERCIPPLRDYALPAWNQISNAWASRPMTTGEACTFLREFLSMAGGEIEQDACTTHSCKATLLSWMSKANALNFEDRRLLGHHIPQGSASVLTYSRDEETRLHAEVYKVLDSIKADHFQPDLSRVERLRNLVGFAAEEDVSEGEDEAFYESSLEAEDPEVEDVLDIQHPEPNESNEEVVRDINFDPDVFRRHKITSVLHILADDDHKFLCGRAATSNYDELEPHHDLSSLPFCQQCNR